MGRTICWDIANSKFTKDMGIPLYVRIKQVSDCSVDSVSHITQKSDNSIEFAEKEYQFDLVFTHELGYHPDSQDANDTVTVFVGPTGSGKTTCLKQMLDTTTNTWLQQNWTDRKISAFEIMDNRHVIDLTDNKKVSKPLKQTSVVQLTNVKEAVQCFQSILKNRTTTQTNSNSESSRSCLILKIYEDDSSTTYVDMMGNEKFEKGTSNLFANSTMSSLTQYLKSNGSSGRSANTIINIIFGNPKAMIAVVLTLDPYGDARLIKSSLLNIADLTRQCQPVATKETASTLVPTSLPHYARPTLSSLSPKKSASLQWNRVSKPAPRRQLTFARKIVNTISRTFYGRGSEEKKEKIEKLEGEKTRLESKIQELTDEKEKHLEEILSLDRTRLTLVEDLQLTQAKYEKSERANLDQVAELRGELQTARLTHSELQGLIKTIKSNIETIDTKYQRTFASQKEKEAELSAMARTKDELSEKCTLLTLTIEKLQDTDSQLSTEIDGLKKSLASKENIIKGLEESLKGYDDTKAKLQEQKQLLSDKSASVTNLKNKIENQDKIISERAETIAELKLQVTSSNGQNTKLSEQALLIAQQSSTIKELREEMEFTKQDASLKGEELSAKQDSTIKELELKVTRLEKELAVKDTLKETIAQKVNTIEGLEANNIDLKNQLSEVSEQQEKTLAAKKHLKSTVSELTKEISSLKRLLEDKAASSDKENLPVTSVPPMGDLMNKKFSGDEIFVDQQNRERGSDSSQDKKRKKLGNIDNYRSAMLEMSAKKHKKKSKLHSKKAQAI